MKQRGLTQRALLGAGVITISILLVGLISVLGDRTRFEALPTGDQLGQDSGEAFADYAVRAQDSLATAPADEQVYGLVTFTSALPPERASSALESLARINAVVPPDAAPIAVGEPQQGHDRSQIFEMAVRDRPISSVVARDEGETFRRLAERDDIATVEVLPADAVWGAFGIRPVDAGAAHGDE